MSRAPVTGRSAVLCSSTATASRAAIVSGSGRSVTTWGWRTSTGPVNVTYTSCQIPMFRSRTAGIQSQPTDACMVTFFPMSPVGPPFAPNVPKTSSCGSPGSPGQSGGWTRSASTFRPDRSAPVTGIVNSRNIPTTESAGATRSPFSQTSAR